MPVRRPLLDRHCHRAGFLVVLLGTLLALPSLGAGFWGDDHIFLAMLEDAEVWPETHPLDLFHFAREDLLDTSLPGALGPWWTDDDFRGRFLRPLTAITQGFDYAVWGRWAMGHHLTQLLLWAALLVVVTALFRELGQVSGRGRPAVLLAGLVYAVDEAHVVPVQWLANRNALLSVLLSVVAIHAYLRWRRRSDHRWLGLSLAAFALGTLAGETAIAVPAWAIAWELTMTRGPAGERVRAATPLVAAGLVYLGLYSGLGFGVSGSAMYESPLSDPVGFLSVLPVRLSVLAAATVTPLPAEAGITLPGVGMSMAAVLAAVVLAIFLVLILPLIRRDRTVRFALVAAGLSLIPVCGTFPHNRVLLLPTVGTAWLIGCWLDDFSKEWFHARSRGFRPSRSRRAGAWAMVLMHGIGPLALWPTAAYLVHTWGSSEVELARQADLAEDDDDLVLLLNTPNPFGLLHLHPVLHSVDRVRGAGLHTLSATLADQRFVRTGENSFTLETRHPGYLRGLLEGLYRDGPVVEGQVFDVYADVGLTVRADRVEDGHLLRFEVTLDRSLDSPDLVISAWNGERLAWFSPPPVGGCAVVPFSDPHMPFPVAPPWKDACALAGPPQPSPAPAPAARDCALELLIDGDWLHREDVRCPGEDGLVFVSAGDVGSAGRILDLSVAAMQDVCAQAGCSLMTLPGDLLYGAGSTAEKDWRQIWDDSLARVGLPALTVLGNHAYRHAAGPEKRQEVLFASDGRNGMVLPGPSWTARVSRDGETLVAFAGLDTDSLAVPRPEAPGLGEQALHDACATGAPVVMVGHHPLSTQGTHHGHEQAQRRSLRELSRAVIHGDGCRLVLTLHGHDHDQQAWPPGCQEPLNPGTVVSGVAARGYRARGSRHLEPCPASGEVGSYHSGPREAGGFALLRVRPDTGAVRVQLIDVPGRGQREVLSDLSW